MKTEQVVYSDEEIASIKDLNNKISVLIGDFEGEIPDYEVVFSIIRRTSNFCFFKAPSYEAAMELLNLSMDEGKKEADWFLEKKKEIENGGK